MPCRLHYFIETTSDRLYAEPYNHTYDMSGTETERKFLVRKAGREWRRLAVAQHDIRQGYMACKGATVRVRLKDDRAFLTIKGPSASGLSRYEFEKEISADEAHHLLQLCRGGLIEKTRYIVPAGRHICEVDEFHGANDGLVMAEIELGSEDEAYTAPPFVAAEVTGDRRFYNSHLLTNPYSLWRDTIPEECR